MNDSHSSGSLSPWWALLLLPIGLGVGWFMGQMPTPRSTPLATAEVSSHVATTTSPTPPTTRVASAAGIQAEVQRADPNPAPAPVAAETPADNSPPSEFSDWMTMDQALVESKRNGKPILIDFNAEWCPPCRAMKSELFDDATHGLSLQRVVIPVSLVDRVREDGENPADLAALQRRFEVNAFPTLIVLNPQTGRSLKTQGFGDADRTYAWITAAAKSVR